MLRYAGWDEAASRRPRDETPAGTLQSPLHDTIAPTQTLRSFTPINQGPASMSVAKDIVRARPRGLDSDKLYDIPDIPLAGSPAPKKRRKVSTEPARPTKTPVSVPTHPWQKANGMEFSQLNTVPNSKKRSRKRSPTQMELFSSAGITKSILGSTKLVTTEDALKSKSAILGQTTVDNLASFRFQHNGRCLSGIEASGFADPTERVLAETGKSHGSHQDTGSHDGDTSAHTFCDHGPVSYNEMDLYPVLDDGDLMSYNEDELYHEFLNADNICHSPEGSYQVFDEAAMLNEEEVSATQGVVAPVAQPESEDEFPLDDDLEVEMAQLSMPDKMHGNGSPIPGLRSMQKDNLRSTDAENVHTQPSSPTLYTLITDHDIALNIRGDKGSSASSVTYRGNVPRSFDEAVEWPSISDEELDRVNTRKGNLPGVVSPLADPSKTLLFTKSDDYLPLKPFARPPFPSKVRDRSPIAGISSSTILRTCFRIGEALREGALCEGLEQDAIIELFARVRNSSSDIVTPSKLYFEFADLFHDRPPFLRGTLENKKISGLQEAESRMLQGVNGSSPMTRCLGKLKKATAGPPGWMLHIINVRPTDWEEVRWTRQIARAGTKKQ